MSDKIFVNVASGLDWLPDLAGQDVSFIRIQSTACEQKRWNDLLREVDANLLMNLALGHRCVVYDASAKRDVSRALWQGVELLRHCLIRAWGIPTEKMPDCPRGGESMWQYFEDVWNNELDVRTKRRLRYFRNFLWTDVLRLEYECRRTDKDGRYDELAMLVQPLAAEPSATLVA